MTKAKIGMVEAEIRIMEAGMRMEAAEIRMVEAEIRMVEAPRCTLEVKITIYISLDADDGISRMARLRLG